MALAVCCEHDLRLLTICHSNIPLTPLYPCPLIARLYKDQLVFFIRKTMESSDTAKIVAALQVFSNVFQEGEWELSLVLGISFLWETVP